MRKSASLCGGTIEALMSDQGSRGQESSLLAKVLIVIEVGRVLTSMLVSYQVQYWGWHYEVLVNVDVRVGLS